MLDLLVGCSTPHRRTAARLARKCGLAVAANTKPGKHLPYSHPAMSHLRNWVAFQVGSGRFHCRLVANFDQVWSLRHRPRSTTLQVNKKDPIAKQRTLRQLRHRLELSLDMPLTESFEKQDKPRVPRELATGGMVSHCPVEQWRVPHTLTTLSWRDGHVGRGWVTFQEDQLSEKQRATLNKDWWQESVLWW